MWTNFLNESKRYMNHSDHWNPKTMISRDERLKGIEGWTIDDANKAKIKFWKQFPLAGIKFYYFILKDYIREYYHKCIININIFNNEKNNRQTDTRIR